mmetsp:Transcript_4893/g.17172  ORF Transcript_4893/g.17172 Transcript_4893/m.17172 type:complete len:89 (-) Transcript_4893:204-470(-)
MGSRREGTQAEKRKRGCDREEDDVAGECGDLDNLTRKVQRLRASLEQAGEADLDGGGRAEANLREYLRINAVLRELHFCRLKRRDGKP